MEPLHFSSQSSYCNVQIYSLGSNFVEYLGICVYIRPMNDLCRSLHRDVYCFICVHSNIVLLYCLTSLFDLLSIICNLSDLGEL